MKAQMNTQNTESDMNTESRSIYGLVRQVDRGVIYAMSEESMTKWERGEIRFKVGQDKVEPVVHGRTGHGFNVSFA